MAPPGSRVEQPLHAELVGQRMNLQFSKEATWTLPSLAMPVSPVLETPLIVDLDVNQRMRAAKKVLRRVKTRVSMTVKKVSFKEVYWEKNTLPALE